MRAISQVRDAEAMGNAGFADCQPIFLLVSMEMGLWHPGCLKAIRQ
jgi:hypothetical protein